MPFPPIIETPVGPVNGTNKLFVTSMGYIPKTPVVFLDGQAKRRDWDDGWFELGSGKIEMKLAPEAGSVVQVYYVPSG